MRVSAIAFLAAAAFGFVDLAAPSFSRNLGLGQSLLRRKYISTDTNEEETAVFETALATVTRSVLYIFVGSSRVEEVYGNGNKGQGLIKQMISQSVDSEKIAELKTQFEYERHEALVIVVDKALLVPQYEELLWNLDICGIVHDADGASRTVNLEDLWFDVMCKCRNWKHLGQDIVGGGSQ